MFYGIFVAAAVFSLFSFAGCIKTYKIAPSETPQGTEHKDNRSLVKNNIRSVRVYDQWATKASFDVLWMSDDVRKEYVESYCKRRGESEQEKDQMMTEQLHKNKRDMSFYVLADVRDKNHPMLSDKNAAWTCYLTFADGEKIPAENVKEISEFKPEISALFGYRYNKKFKTPYLVTFHAAASRAPFSLVISSVSRECHLRWNERNGKHAVQVKTIHTKEKELSKDEDYYWV